MPTAAQERAKAAENKRAEPRLRPGAVEIAAVKLANGEPVDLINVSRSGILIEGKTRFIAGTRLTLVFEGAVSPNTVRGKVVRCLVSSIAGGALRYQSGVVFDKRVDLQSTDTVTESPTLTPAPEPPQPVELSTAVRGRTSRSLPSPGGVRNRW